MDYIELIKTIYYCIRIFGFSTTIMYIKQFVKNVDDIRTNYDSNLIDYLKDEINYGVDE